MLQRSAASSRGEPASRALLGARRRLRPQLFMNLVFPGLRPLGSTKLLDRLIEFLAPRFAVCFGFPNLDDHERAAVSFGSNVETPALRRTLVLKPRADLVVEVRRHLRVLDDVENCHDSPPRNREGCLGYQR